MIEEISIKGGLVIVPTTGGIQDFNHIGSKIGTPPIPRTDPNNPAKKPATKKFFIYLWLIFLRKLLYLRFELAMLSVVDN